MNIKDITPFQALMIAVLIGGWIASYTAMKTHFADFEAQTTTALTKMDQRVDKLEDYARNITKLEVTLEFMNKRIENMDQKINKLLEDKQ